MPMIDRFRFLKVSLAMVLAIVGVKDTRPTEQPPAA
jgi:hypothetical protein